VRLTKLWPPLLTGAAFFCLYLLLGPAQAPELNLLLSSADPAASYDPSAIRYTKDYFFLENVFSPLLEYSSGDELVSGAAERFEWAGSEARFRMRAGLKTAGGRAIDAFDAERSLKRLFILGGPGHDFLRTLLCGGAALKTLSDPCPGIEVREGGRLLVLKFNEKKTFLFHLLANISFAIIPMGSVDPGTLKIRDYGNTSGPYFVSVDAGGGSMELRANPRHYRYSKKMPQKVKIVPLTEELENDKILEYLSGGKIDYLMNGIVRSPEDKAGFVAANPGYNIRFSQPIRMIYVVFTGRGLKRLTLEERFYIGKKLREIYKPRHKMCETPDQIFKMEGALSREQLAAIRAGVNAPGDRVIKKQLTARRLYGYFPLDSDEIRKWLPNTGYADLPPLSARKDPPEPDFYILGCDIGFQDDVGLLSYYLEMDFFPLTAEAKKKWFADYVSAPAKKDRVTMLRALHYETLRTASALPVALLPYASVARKPWTFNFPGMLSGDHLWRLRRE